jgi:hypothetical protein
MSSTGLYDATFPGALIRIAPNGTQTVIARKGLVAPTGLAVDHGMIYVSNHGFSAGTGPGPHGEVIRIGRPNDG